MRIEARTVDKTNPAPAELQALVLGIVVDHGLVPLIQSIGQVNGCQEYRS